jgi:hypothetical protein
MERYKGGEENKRWQDCKSHEKIIHAQGWVSCFERIYRKCGWYSEIGDRVEMV